MINAYYGMLNGSCHQGNIMGASLPSLWKGFTAPKNNVFFPMNKQKHLRQIGLNLYNFSILKSIEKGFSMCESLQNSILMKIVLKRSGHLL
jgi:hypothetical protein